MHQAELQKVLSDNRLDHHELTFLLKCSFLSDWVAIIGTGQELSVKPFSLLSTNRALRARWF
jgi:hypothetical protein